MVCLLMKIESDSLNNYLILRPILDVLNNYLLDFYVVRLQHYILEDVDFLGHLHVMLKQ